MTDFFFLLYFIRFFYVHLQKKKMMTFDEDIIQQVWNKGLVQKGYDPDSARKDACGAWMLRNQYGNTDSIFGWEIDHVLPKTKGGTNDLINLRPMQWQNNRSKGDDYPSYTACVKSNGNENLIVESLFTVNSSLQQQLMNLISR